MAPCLHPSRVPKRKREVKQMKQIKSIMLATDFSEASKAAGRYAITLSTITGAHLHVLHVINELDEPQRVMIPHEAFRILEQELETQAVAALKKFCAEGAADIATTIHAVVGNPFQQIIKASKELGVDMIIMGTHGRTGVELVIVGSTAERVVRHSRIPVLTVRGND